MGKCGSTSCVPLDNSCVIGSESKYVTILQLNQSIIILVTAFFASMCWSVSEVIDVHHQQTRHPLARVGQGWPYPQQFQKGPYLARTGQMALQSPRLLARHAGSLS